MKNQVWKIKLEKLYFLSISNWNFVDYTSSKDQVWNRQKIKLILLDFSNLIFQNWFFKLDFSNLIFQNWFFKLDFSKIQDRRIWSLASNLSLIRTYLTEFIPPISIVIVVGSIPHVRKQGNHSIDLSSHYIIMMKIVGFL